MRKDHPRSNCPVSFALDIFGDKWSLLIIRDLIFRGKRRYGEFLRSDEGISTNILADRLERLETEGILAKIPDPDRRSKHRYRLTAKGMDLLPVLLEIVAWSTRYHESTGVPRDFLERLQHDKEALAREIRDRLSSIDTRP